ncbi:hypothetical protein ACTXT7_007700 [Hymenolepis weldensis]
MSKRAHRFPSFYNRRVLARPHPNDSYKAISVFHTIVSGSYASCSSPLSLSSLPSLTRCNPHCAFAEMKARRLFI